jgi:hypothetical protein
MGGIGFFGWRNQKMPEEAKQNSSFFAGGQIPSRGLRSPSSLRCGKRGNLPVLDIGARGAE